MLGGMLLYASLFHVDVPTRFLNASIGQISVVPIGVRYVYSKCIHQGLDPNTYSLSYDCPAVKQYCGSYFFTLLNTRRCDWTKPIHGFSHRQFDEPCSFPTLRHVLIGTRPLVDNAEQQTSVDGLEP